MAAKTVSGPGGIEAAEGYRAMDERRAIRVLLTV